MRHWPLCALVAVSSICMRYSHGTAQALPAAVGAPGRSSSVDSALRSMLEWSASVRAGAGAGTWLASSAWFQHQISQAEWSDWVREQHRQWQGVGPPRVVRVGFTHDEPPLPPAEWVEVVLVSDRTAGGQFVERLWALRQGPSPWGIVDYAVWPDPKAIVTNAYFAPIPYLSIPTPHWFRHAHRLRPAARTPGASPAGSRAVANPKTLPRRPG